MAANEHPFNLTDVLKSANPWTPPEGGDPEPETPQTPVPVVSLGQALVERVIKAADERRKKLEAEQHEKEVESVMQFGYTREEAEAEVAQLHIDFKAAREAVHKRAIARWSRRLSAFGVSFTAG
jgi:dienelactone hydrolase